MGKTILQTHMLGMGSDHILIMLNSQNVLRGGNKSFRVMGTWLKEPECIAVIKETWKRKVNGSKAHKLA